MRATGAKLITAFRMFNADQCPLLAAGIAFYTFLALFPALIALEFLYGLVADPATLVSQIETITSTLPGVARKLIAEQLAVMASSPRPVLGIGFVIAVLTELWSVSGVVGNLFGAVNTAYRVPDDRGWVRRKLLALAAAVVSILFMAVVVVMVVLAPQLIAIVGGPAVLGWVLEGLRWLILVSLTVVGVRLVYRFGPHRRATRPRLISAGAVVATLIWFAASAGFAIYVDLFGSHAETYGALAGVAVLLLWLWLAGYAILLGAEINSTFDADQSSP
ncbi:YihY/virulence factor BrkB family protein [Microlunatus elymi]|uniref:YihY/virulence factor BrkB family protein n=1 Tax=Microlunatus elymi TaxID=2596828 RepID=A0A516PZW4_9ACTN|nr:YihY/virulence factor BrkB family protein [Microlunatus elymi]QDP96708.1 YihY/virulence factor BrkB family protein [Microlunatus elymi]